MGKVAIRTVSDDDIVERFEDYAIQVSIEDYCVEFIVKEIAGETVSPPPEGLWLYTVKDAVCNMDTTTVFNDGETFLHGSIKWDGCSNWDFHTSEVMAHFCGRQGATSIGRLMDRMYQITKERLRTYDVDCAEN